MDEAGLFGSLPARLYALCALLLVLKMMALATYTGVLRGRRKAFSSPEDYRFQGQSPSLRSDPDVERARRAHRNDLENILPFLVWSLSMFGLYLLSALTLFLALLLLFPVAMVSLYLAYRDVFHDI